MGMKPGPKGQKPKCHPERVHFASGECRKCYAKRKAKGYYPTAGRRRHFQSKYGWSLEQLAQEIQDSKGKCDICFSVAKLHVDHCHESGEVRGLLCGPCNRGLGLLRDSGPILISAATYLARAEGTWSWE